MIGVHLQIAGIPGARLAAIQEYPPLAECGAADDRSTALRDGHTPSLALELVEGEEVGTAIDAEAQVPHHWARGRERDQAGVVGYASLAYDEVGTILAQTDGCHFSTRQMTMRD